MAMSTVWW